MVGSEKGASIPAKFRAERHASPPLPENISNRTGEIGSRSQDRKADEATVKALTDRGE
jgi:hypothetical protein